MKKDLQPGGSSMLCERCGKYPVSKVKTVLANDEKVLRVFM